MSIIGADDLLDQPMPNDILLVKIHKLNAIDIAQNIADFD